MNKSVPSELLRRYETLRALFLRYGNFHPDSDAPCHHSLQNVRLPMATLMMDLAIFADDAALALAAAPAQPEQGESLKYLTNIPDHHDRFVWRNRYYMLPPRCEKCRLAEGCTRSHPPEDMNAECQVKTVKARADNAAATLLSEAEIDKLHKAYWHGEYPDLDAIFAQAKLANRRGEPVAWKRGRLLLLDKPSFDAGWEPLYTAPTGGSDDSI